MACLEARETRLIEPESETKVTLHINLLAGADLSADARTGIDATEGKVVGAHTGD